MIMRDSNRLRRALAPLLAALSVASAAVVPLLDAVEPERGAVLESAHDRASCARRHDHGLCTQVAANAGISAAPPRHGLLQGSARRPPTRPLDSRPPRLDRFLPLGPRAPPLA